ncbi:hypothetical protein HY333_01010, partial [Candidatus Collierbacteria bacterium]|nr:hypothetical protein [Candidatus Collierbacteria bacterium]
MSTNSKNLTQYRLRLIILISPLLSLILISRLFYWQIIRGPRLSSKANRQHQVVTNLSAKRGDILDRNGTLLAGTQNLFHLYAYKPLLDQPVSNLPELLSPILASPDASSSALTETKNYLEDRLSLSSSWISLKHFLTHNQKTAIENLNIKGLGFESEFVRYYPEASLSAHVLGFVGSDIAGQEQGYFGLEGYFDRQLKGRSGKVVTEKDAFGNPILIGKFDLLKNIEGRSLKTSLDRKIQFLVESLLKEGLQKYQAAAGNVIIMESKT